MTDNDEWLAAAFSDTDLVAEVLITLRTPPPSKRQTPAWTIHQRRSRTQPPIQPSATKSEPPRASPSTPLSWSAAAASVSGGGAVISRSNKVSPNGENTPTKRPRKKKTLATLKEEEVLLMEEQSQLKRKLIALQSNCEKQRKQNQSLKKMKLDFEQANNKFEDVYERKDRFFLPDLNDPVGEDVIVSY